MRFFQVATRKSGFCESDFFQGDNLSIFSFVQGGDQKKEGFAEPENVFTTDPDFSNNN